MKHKSKYEAKFLRRKASGAIHYSITVDREGQPTLNAHDFVYRNGVPQERSFTRIRRNDEMKLDLTTS